MLGGEPSVGNIVFNVNDSGDIENCRDIHCEYLDAGGIVGVAADSSTSDGWTIGEYLDWIYEEINMLSDETVKTNIIDINSDEALKFLIKSKPVTFQYKRDGRWSAGFIAQEVEKLEDELEIYYPLVSLSAKENKYKINYIQYIPIIIAALKNIQEQINNLTGEVA